MKLIGDMVGCVFVDNLLGGKYKVEKILGSGGMGTVYLARNVVLDNLWAVKSIRKTPNAEYDFLAEPNILKRLSHPSLPHIVDIFEDEHNIYIVEDFIDGLSLDAGIKIDGVYSEEVVVDWAKQLCNVLIYLHNQKPHPIIYRDLKPGNIIIDNIGNLHLIDFGIAREYKAEAASDTNYIGTKGYAAPEQYGGAQTTVRTDIYSFGITMYYLLTGQNPNVFPFDIKPLREINPNLSPAIEYIINKCIQIKPENRYQCAEELLTDLNCMSDITRVFDTRQKKKSRKGLVVTIVTAAAVLICAFSVNLIVSAVKNYREGKIQTFYTYLDNNEIAKATEEADSLPNGLDGDIARAALEYKTGNYDGCMEILDSYITSNRFKDSAEANHLYGLCLYMKEDYGKCLKYFKAAYSLAESDEEIALDTACAYVKNSDFESAKNIVSSLFLDDEQKTNYINAQIAVQNDDVTGASELFKRVVDSSDDDMLIRNTVMEFENLYRNHNTGNAIANSERIMLYEKALSKMTAKDDTAIIEMLSLAYYDDENYAKSAQMSKKLIDLGYDMPYIYRNLAIVYQMRNDFDKAEDVLNLMEELYPDNYQCYVQKALLYLDIESNKPSSKRNYQKVLENYNKASEKNTIGVNATDLTMLKNKVDELRANGWL